MFTVAISYYIDFVLITAGLVILITGKGLIEYFCISFLSKSRTLTDCTAIGLKFGGFLTFITLKLNDVPIWIMPLAKVTVTSNLPVGNYIYGLASEDVIHIFSITHETAVKFKPSGMHYIPSFKFSVLRSSSSKVISFVKSTSISCPLTISYPEMNLKLYSVLSPVTKDAISTLKSKKLGSFFM